MDAPLEINSDTEIENFTAFAQKCYDLKSIHCKFNECTLNISILVKKRFLKGTEEGTIFLNIT